MSSDERADAITGAVAPADREVMDRIVASSPLRDKYAETLDRDSAHEMLAGRLEAGAAAAEAAQPAPEPTFRYPKRSSPPKQEQGSVVHDILACPVAKDLARTAAREILRGVFGTARRR